MRLVITDSGIGGLSICAAIERRLRESAARPGEPAVRLTYVNVWPDERYGYNDLPEVAARAAVFDRALDAIDALRPDAIVLACNTLSIVFRHTGRARRGGGAPVFGIIETGVRMCHEALTSERGSAIVILGTKTTIESDVHRQGLLELGAEAGRIAPVACPGLAKAIENDPRAPAVRERIADCAAAAARTVPVGGGLLFAALCCTHYGYVAGEIREAIALATGREVRTLDPNDRLADAVAAWTMENAPRPLDAGAEGGTSGTAVEVVSKVTIDEERQMSVARLVEGVSPATAHALISYSRVPALF